MRATVSDTLGPEREVRETSGENKTNRRDVLEDEGRASAMGRQAAEIARQRFDPERTATRLFTELRRCVRQAS